MPDTTDSADSEEPTADHRKTAPQQPYSMRQVGAGVLVLVVGVAIAYGLPLLT